MTRAEGLSDERAENIFRQALGYVAFRPHARDGGVGVAGFSTGARLDLLGTSTHPDDVRACAGFSPTRITPDSERGRSLPGRLDVIRRPVLSLCGGTSVSFCPLVPNLNLRDGAQQARLRRQPVRDTHAAGQHG